MKIKLYELIIEPQPTTYSIDGPWPTRIGDQTYIRAHKPTWGVYPSKVTKVILLRDASGRQWLVECK